MDHSGYKMLMPGNFASMLVAVLLAFGILFCFFIVGFQIALAYLEFYIIASLSVVTIGFAGLNQTKFIGEKGVGALFSVSIKLMVFSFLAVIMSETVTNYENIPYDFYSYLKILFGSLFFVFFGNRVCKVAGNLLNGGGVKF